VARRKDKKTKFREAPRAIKKTTSFSRNPDNANQKTPTWKIDSFDYEGEWGVKKLGGDVIWRSIFPKIRHFESMTWAQIERNKKWHHSVKVSELSADAQKRAAQLRIDVDDLFRFRLSGAQRLWGIRDVWVQATSDSVLWGQATSGGQATSDSVLFD
jgi:hypothetical protein